MMELERVSAGYNGGAVIMDISMRVEPGRVTALIGPNGSGKSTLLRVAARILRPQSGKVLLDGRDAKDYSRLEYAKRVAMFAQTRDAPALTVREFAAHGRFPHMTFPRRMRENDWRIVDEALKRASVAEIARRDLRDISGGERQRAYFAMTLCQSGDVVLLDEPAAYLDAERQFDLLAKARELSRSGKAVVMALHSISQALEYADYVAVLNGGRLRAFSAPDGISGELLAEVFKVRVCRAEAEDGGRHFLVLPRL